MALRAAFVLALLLALTPSAAQAQTAGFSFNYSRYSDSTHLCDNQTNQAGVYGREPADGLRHPVLIYTHGAAGMYATAEGKKIVDVAAERGFVAASVDYDSWLWIWWDSVFTGNAKCIYGAGGVLPQLCARPAADCSKGWVAVGFSKGAAIAARAKGYGARATYLMGYAGESWGAQGVNGRTDERVIDGEAENPDRALLNLRTGQSCPTTSFSCLRPDGTGWLLVRNSEVADGQADHCWMQQGGCSWNETYEPRWLPPYTLPWSLNTNLDWLKARTG